MASIKSITATKILDSRSDWTIQVTITLDDGSQGTAAVPAGASVGAYEAKLVEPEEAIKNIEEKIEPALIGTEATKQEKIDQTMLELDGTEDKTKLGGNSLLAVSLASSVAAAASQKIPLYKYIRILYNPEKKGWRLPTPLFNLINGGAHAENNLDIQEFMVTPATHVPYSEGIEMGDKIYDQLKNLLTERGFSTALGDEGGFAPQGLTTQSALNFLKKATTDSNLVPGKDIYYALDVAANALTANQYYKFKAAGYTFSSKEIVAFYQELVTEYPIIYLEDPLNEDSWKDWAVLIEAVGDKTEIIGDDLTVTNTERVKKAVEEKAITGLIIKPNQIGTLTEALEVARYAEKNNLVTSVSHRSGETSDPFIADLAVGIGSLYIKTGAPARGERVAKYNRLLQIEKELKQEGKL